MEFYGAGVAKVALYNRATIGNMSPEYGSTCAIFPIDDETLRYLRFTGRSEERAHWWRPTPRTRACGSTLGRARVLRALELDLSSVEPSLAGPARPQDRVPLRRAKVAFGESLTRALPGDAQRRPAGRPRRVPCR